MKEVIQWCIIVLFIWDFFVKVVMKNCMVNVGLVGGIDGSFYLFVMVLELEVVLFYCYKVMS